MCNRRGGNGEEGGWLVLVFQTDKQQRLDWLSYTRYTCVLSSRQPNGLSSRRQSAVLFLPLCCMWMEQSHSIGHCAPEQTLGSSYVCHLGISVKHKYDVIFLGCLFCRCVHQNATGWLCCCHVVLYAVWCPLCAEYTSAKKSNKAFFRCSCKSVN